MRKANIKNEKMSDRGRERKKLSTKYLEIITTKEKLCEII